MGKVPETPRQEALERALEDLRGVLGDALIIGGIAVIHYGYERTTKYIDILYANWDNAILKRLAVHFKHTLKAESGWHHFEHKKNKVRVELVPEGGLTRCGFIPGPKAVGAGKSGVISLFGLTWLKLVSDRPNDIGDLYKLALLHLDKMQDFSARLPAELRVSLQNVLERARADLHTGDPHQRPETVGEAPAAYARKKPRTAKAKRKKLSA